MTYPTSLDELTDGVPSDGAAPTTELDDATYPHDDHHRALAVAVEAVETELGTDPSGASADVGARIAAVEILADAAQTSAEVAAAVAAEAALARNADNLTSGTVADARVASTIARDSEVSAAISTSESGQVRDGDTAGGVLSGTYPNPGFASDMATQAELDAEATLARNGDNITSGTVADARIASTIARDSEVAAAYQPLDADLTDLAAIADAQGDIIVRGASGWERLAKSATATDVLTAGASQPAWTAAAAGGGNTNMLPKISGGAQQVGVPGVSYRGGVGSVAQGINRDMFSPLIVSKALTITLMQIEVTAAPASNSTIYVGIFAADNDMQPTGAAYLNSSIACASGSTGVKSLGSLSVALPAGNYVSMFNIDVALSIRFLITSSPTWAGPAMGANYFVGQTYAARTAGAFTSPNPAGWTTANIDSAAYSWCQFQWTTP